jgi:SAM-dependent methyltransferase
LADETFDMVTAVASLHHTDALAALEKMRDLLRPGGVLVVIGLARGLAFDIALSVPAVLGNRMHLLADARRRSWRSPGPSLDRYRSPTVWPPPMTYRDMRGLAERLLPGVRYRRHLYWRYSLTWTKPA